MPISLDDIAQFNKRFEWKRKEIVCEDCERVLTKTELQYCKQYYWYYCFLCQKNHSTKKTNQMFRQKDWNLVSQNKYFKSKII